MKRPLNLKIFKNYREGAFNKIFSLLAKFIDLTELFTAFKSLTTKLFIDGK